MNITNALDNIIHLNIIITIILIGGACIKLIMIARKELKNNKQTKVLQQTLEDIYGIDKLMESLGRYEIRYPVLVYGGKRAEVSYIENMQEYISQYYRRGIGADYILDNDGNRYALESIAGKEIPIPIPELDEHMFEKLIYTGDTKTFQDMKTQVLESIDIYEKQGGSVYSEQVANLKKTTSVREIVYELKKGSY